MKMSRVYNFSAGPAVLPEEVLKEAAAEMLDYNGTGMSVMEMSHRSKAFEEIIQTAEQDIRDLLKIPDAPAGGPGLPGIGALAGCARGGGRVPLWGRGGGRGGADPGHAPPHPRERHGGGPLAGHQPKNFISKAPTVSHRLQLASDLIYRMTQMKL